MPNYGKALSAYKKINDIKSSVKNINNAKNKIAKQRGEAIEANRNLTFDKQMLNSLKGIVTGAGTAILSETDQISGEAARNLGTGLDTLGSLAIEAKGNVRNHAGLGQQGAINQEERARIDIVGDALGTYNFLDSHYKEKKGTDIISSIKDAVEKNPDLSKEEILAFIDEDEVDFKQGRGYNVTPSDVINSLKEQANYMSRSGAIESEEEDEYVDDKIDDRDYFLNQVFGD